MPRMKILNGQEREAFESPPNFNSAERKRFFSLPLVLNKTVEGLRTPTNQACFIVAAGYFQARRKFFAKQFRPRDVGCWKASKIDHFSGLISVEN
jgi:hypothetical protein